MLKDKGGVLAIAKDSRFTSSLVSVVWDEAHCIGKSGWGSFRPGYLDAGCVKAMLPSDVPFLVTSATLDGHTLAGVMTTLRMNPSTTTTFRRSNDRPNVHLTVRQIQHPLKSYRDLELLLHLLSPDWKPGDPPPPKFLVFFDNIAESVAAANKLRGQLPSHLRVKLV